MPPEPVPPEPVPVQPVPAEPTPPEPTPTAHESPIAVYGAIVANLGIAVAKFIAAYLTGSSAMISEGIHSVVDTGNQVLLLFGIHRGRRPPDEMHAFGHGKELYFWSLIVAILLFGVGGGLAVYEGVTSITDPHPLEDPLANYVVLALALVLESASWTIAAREMAKQVGRAGIVSAIRGSKDPSIVTVLLEDTAALIGLIVAGGAIFLAHQLQDPRLDGVGSLVIGVVLAGVAAFLAYESRGLLVGEQAEPGLIETLRRVLEEDDAVDRVERIRTMHLGPLSVLATVEVRFKSGAADDVGATVDRLHQRLRAADARLGDVTIEPVAVRTGIAASPDAR